MEGRKEGREERRKGGKKGGKEGGKRRVGGKEAWDLHTTLEGGRKEGRKEGGREEGGEKDIPPSLSTLNTYIHISTHI